MRRLQLPGVVPAFWGRNILDLVILPQRWVVGGYLVMDEPCDDTIKRSFIFAGGV